MKKIEKHSGNDNSWKDASDYPFTETEIALGLENSFPDESGNIPLEVFRKYAKSELTRISSIAVFREIFYLIRGYAEEERLGNIAGREDLQATAVLLYAVNHKEFGQHKDEYGLHWTDLRTLIQKKYDYVKAFSFYCPNMPEPFTQQKVISKIRPVNVDNDRELFSAIDTPPDDPRAYIKFIRAQCFLLTKKPQENPLAAEALLEYRSPEFWKKFSKSFDETERYCQKTVVAKAYLTKLRQDPDFNQELKELVLKVDLLGWQYGHGEGGYFRSLLPNQGLCRISDSTTPWNLNKEMGRTGRSRRAIEAFCVKRCLEEIVVVVDKKTTTITSYSVVPMRIKVKPADDNSGLTVFIPRFYRFSHIKNYAEKDKDFAHLRRCMDEVFVSFQRPRKRSIRLKTIMSEAKALRRRSLREGKKGCKAWDIMFKMVHKKYGWDMNRTGHMLGKRPKTTREKNAKKRLAKERAKKAKQLKRLQREDRYKFAQLPSSI